MEDFRWEEIPFENNPHWIGMNIEQLMRDPPCRTRPGCIEHRMARLPFISIDLDYCSSIKEALKLLNCHTRPIGNGNLDAED